MILELIGLWVLAAVAVAVIADVILPWARRVVNSVANAVSSVLYAVQDVLNAVFTIYVYDGHNAITQEKKVPFNKLPADVQAELKKGQKVKVAMGS